jgi:hypothetical protein
MVAVMLSTICAAIPFDIVAQAPPGSGSKVLPSTVDLRSSFEQWSLARSQQGNRPTCSAFTVAGAIEFAVAKRQGHSPRLSVEFLNWAANKSCGDTNDGGFFSDLWRGFTNHGICATSDWPYQPALNPTNPPPPEASADAKTRLGLGLRFNWIKEWDVNTGLTDAHVSAIKRTLSDGWPVCGGFRWPKREKWLNDVLQMCPSNAVRDGHSVLLVGYCDEAAQPGGGVFIFRNTAGAGRDAFMPYEYVRAYMNDAAWIDFEARPKPPTSAAAPAAVLHDPLAGLIVLPTGRSRRISSNEQPKWQDANLDMNILPPGKAIEMPLLEGPGVINHIWFTSHAGRVNELNALTLRIYWDGRKEPGVEAPLGEFFAVGHDRAFHD